MIKKWYNVNISENNDEFFTRPARIYIERKKGNKIKTQLGTLDINDINW